MSVQQGGVTSQTLSGGPKSNGAPSVSLRGSGAGAASVAGMATSPCPPTQNNEHDQQFTLDIHSPSHTSRLVSDEELAGVYDSLGDDSVITWNDGSDKDVLIASVHAGFSTVSLRHEDTWYWLVSSDDASLVEIVLCGLEAWVPAGAILPRQAGLAALGSVTDVPGMLSKLRWREQ
jgi:hypothetical protein